MKQAEENDQNILAEADRLLMSGDYKATLNFINKNKTALVDEKLSETEAWAYIGQGVALDDLGRTQSGAKQQATFKLAGDKYQQAIKIKPDDSNALFNFACLEALRGNETECRKWLKKRILIEPLNIERINDPDFDSVRDKAWFKKLVG